MPDNLTAALVALQDVQLPRGVRCVIFVAQSLEDEEGFRSAFTHNFSDDQLALSLVALHVRSFLEEEEWDKPDLDDG